jgi:hypothetical protein
MYDAATTTGPTETHVKASSSGGTVDLTAITTQLTTVLSSLTALETDLSLVEAATSKLSFESVYVNTDPYFNNVSFKAEFNGTHGATAIASDTGLVGTNDYTPSLTTAIKRTGVSSLRLLNSMVYWPDNASQDFGAGDFTIEFSFRADSIPDASTYNGIIGKRYNNSDASYIVCLYNNTLNFLSGDGFALQYSTALSVDTWYDVAISRNGTTIKMYINGVATTGDCTTLNIPVVNAPLMVGALSHSMSGSYMFAGYLDRVRLTKGVGRYGSVAPVSPVTTEYPTSLLGEVGSYKVVANTPDTSALQAALVAKLDDIRNRVNAVHFIVKDE